MPKFFKVSKNPFDVIPVIKEEINSPEASANKLPVSL
jgi:hypothetical protein